jgi:fumarylacetoacetase
LKFIVPKQAKSWVEVPDGSHFSIQNLPFGMILRNEETSVATRIGDKVFDFRAAADAQLIDFEPDTLIDMETLIEETGPDSFRTLREQAYRLLVETNPMLLNDLKMQRRVLFAIDDCEAILPMHIGAFVDFYSGIHHASNVGKMFRPEGDPLLANYRWLPVGYNGRGSSVVVSGEAITRPNGQTKNANEEEPIFGPTNELDFELELGFLTIRENDMGVPIRIQEAEEHMLGLVLVNDWSARDVQRWEYQPLGPFLAKSFATSISPWVVTLDALEPFRVEGERQDPPPLSHLRPHAAGHFDIKLEVSIQTERMKKPQVICRTNSRNLYWNFAQQLAHQTSNGTPIEYGDLYASGTISGTEPGTFGSLLELTWRGQKPIVMEETGEIRSFIQDGDTITMSGYCDAEGFRVGLGEVSATIDSAPYY